MNQPIARLMSTWLPWLSGQLRRPEWLVFLPALTLGAYWLGGEGWLMVVALGAPLVFTMAGAFRFSTAPTGATTFGINGLAQRIHVIDQMDHILMAAPDTGRNTVCFVLQVDNETKLVDIHGRSAQTEVLERSAERLSSARVTWWHGWKVAVLLSRWPRPGASTLKWPFNLPADCRRR